MAQTGGHAISAAIEQRDGAMLRKLANDAPGLTDQQRTALKLLADLIDYAAKKKTATS